MPLASIRPDPRNARKHSAQQVRQICRSIAAFGFNVPVLIDRDNCVIAGHGRLQGAKRLGFSEIPVIRLEHLSAAQARAFAIADNRLTELSTWDDRLLGEIFLELSSIDLDFDLDAAGFSMGEIDLRIDGLTQAPSSSDLADDTTADHEGSAVCRPGDLWLLGRHRLFCGDALDETSYRAVLAGEHAHIVFADPPYNVRIAGHVSGLGSTKHREFKMASGEMSTSQFASFLRRVTALLAANSRSGSIHYICMDWRHQAELLAAAQDVYTELKNLCVWVKDNAGMGSFYRSQHELVFVFKSGRARHRNNVELGQFGRNRTNVWSYPGVTGFGRQGDEGNLLALHPTVKPVQLIADALLDASARGEVVLDPFVGSGSTLIAAERVGRLCCGIEIDPLYVDVAIRRWQKHAGQAAIHATTKKNFSETTRETTS